MTGLSNRACFWLSILPGEAMTVHTIPVNDVIEHEADDDCFCGPTPDPVHREDGSIGWVMVHHSVDGREFRERGEQIPKEQP